VPGKNNKHKVFVYALSTCVWCNMLKKFLKDNDIEYEYVDVDLSSREDRAKIKEDIIRRGGELAFPTTIIDDKILITGFIENKLREALGI
ncbi:MAG: glutaredoxin family protein, partial [Candidatus Methanomethyliaceae archaeon]|nr:glutaredoxin family protein [Candidatus Methanomethyliaceae archaeon]